MPDFQAGYQVVPLKLLVQTLTDFRSFVPE